MIQKFLRSVFWIFLGLAITVMSIFVFADSKKYESLFSISQVWAHRGYTENYRQNSIPAFREAISLGATGIEMDIYWDDSLQKFIVSHDKPYILPYGRLLSLSEVLDSVPVTNTHYWLDLKNLTKENEAAIQEKLIALLDSYEAKNRVFVESDNGWQLRKLDKAGIRTLYWVQFSRSFPKKILKLIYLKIIMGMSDFDGITTAYYLYDESFQRNFPNYPVFVWYINDAEKIRELVFSNEKVNVVLTNANIFYLNKRMK